jgi:uncharacterized protein YktB (UPF0637 family)
MYTATGISKLFPTFAASLGDVYNCSRGVLGRWPLPRNYNFACNKIIPVISELDLVKWELLSATKFNKERTRQTNFSEHRQCQIPSKFFHTFGDTDCGYKGSPHFMQGLYNATDYVLFSRFFKRKEGISTERGRELVINNFCRILTMVC